MYIRKQFNKRFVRVSSFTLRSIRPSKESLLIPLAGNELTENQRKSIVHLMHKLSEIKAGRILKTFGLSEKRGGKADVRCGSCSL